MEGYLSGVDNSILLGLFFKISHQFIISILVRICILLGSAIDVTCYNGIGTILKIIQQQAWLNQLQWQQWYLILCPMKMKV